MKKEFLHGIVFMLAATFILCWMWWRLSTSRADLMSITFSNYGAELSINLDSKAKAKDIMSVLEKRNYIQNAKERTAIASFLSQNLEVRSLDKISDLRTEAWKMPVHVADSLGVFSERINDLRANKRFDLLSMLSDSTLSEDSYKNTSFAGNGKITVKIKNHKLISDSALSSIPVFLRAHWLEDLVEAHDSIIAFAYTNAKGVAVFKDLNPELSYSVLPVQEDYSFGEEKGTNKGALKHYSSGIFYKIIHCNNCTSFSFTRTRLAIELFNPSTLTKIREDNAFTVRTPEEYRATVTRWVVFGIMAWWLLFIFLIMKKHNYSGTLLSMLMLLSISCILTMFSIQRPLTDGLNGVIMGQGVLGGIFLIGLIQMVNFKRFYTNDYSISFHFVFDFIDWLFKPYKEKLKFLTPWLKSRSLFKRLIALLMVVIVTLLTLPFSILPLKKISTWLESRRSARVNGLDYLLIAVLLSTLLFTPLCGMVGGMRVNLNLGFISFQPSEIAKYLVVFFMAGYFAIKADVIIAYSRPTTEIKSRSMNKLWTLLPIFLGLGGLMVLYLVLEDMGPGLVLGVTFVILYSLIKSKISFDEGGNYSLVNILTCDFATLIYGVISFGVLVKIGAIVGSEGVFALLWFIIWIFIGLLPKQKQFRETAIMMNMVIAMFLFGGDLLGLVSPSAGERFEQRINMCSNTWGSLGLDDNYERIAPLNPVSNTQVAEGLWGLASGGFSGQGWGKGHPYLIPAGHTDMILESIGEQRGYLGLLLILCAVSVLLWVSFRNGYRSSHPFTFYLVSGIVIVTAVQFFVISLGSTGIIPLTGVTVPFLSYGRVSMILNLSAFGIVLSVVNSDDAKNKVNTVTKYNYTISLVSIAFLSLTLFIVGVFAYYQIFKRNDTILHYAYKLSSKGEPTIIYNPRIDILQKKLHAASIFDRNGVLLATSDAKDINAKENKDKLLKSGLSSKELQKITDQTRRRYYPFGNYLLFMLGDLNESSVSGEYYPLGYMADIQHMSYLRGYDNRVRREDSTIVMVRLKSDKYNPYTYLDVCLDYVTDSIALRDYSALLPLLKSGENSTAVERFNEKSKKRDIKLTIDARLQTLLEQSMEDYSSSDQWKATKKGNLSRASVVVLDAGNGDLLASALYPLPDIEKIKEQKKYYSDNYRDKDWKAYTDMDLGTSFYTYPGSTAKLMSAMSGFMKMGESAANKKYNIYAGDIIEIGKSGTEPLGLITMEDAIVKSSNCYFIHLVNENNTYNELQKIYETTGARIGGAYSYVFNYQSESSLSEKVDQNANKALALYSRFKPDTKAPLGTKRMKTAEWRWAWGQGYRDYELEVTPLSMARVASAIANGGSMPITQYIKDADDKQFLKENRQEFQIDLINSSQASILASYMGKEANQGPTHQSFHNSNIHGKTGTPERDHYKMWKKREVQETVNDAWYVCYIEREGESPLAIAVRIERSAKTSRCAVDLIQSVVLSTLKTTGYIK